METIAFMNTCDENIGKAEPLSESEFEGLLEVFRTLLQWEREMENAKKGDDGLDNHQQGFRPASA